jgi:hypothetical protein
MSTVAEIEAAIEKLPDPQVEELAQWLDTLRQRRTVPPPCNDWFKRARGAARQGITTAAVMAMTRGEE